MTQGPVHDRYRAHRGRIVMETRVARLSSTQESLKEQQVREIQRPRPGTVGAHTHPQRLVPDRVLVLDGYSNPALACVRSLGRAGYTVFVASHRRWPLAAWSRYCAGTCWHAEETLQGFATARAWAHAHGVRIVLPLTELACQLCNADRAQWEALDMIIGCAPENGSGTFDRRAPVRACGGPGRWTRDCARAPSGCSRPGGGTGRPWSNSATTGSTPRGSWR